MSPTAAATGLAQFTQDGWTFDCPAAWRYEPVENYFVPSGYQLLITWAASGNRTAGSNDTTVWLAPDGTPGASSSTGGAQNS